MNKRELIVYIVGGIGFSILRFLLMFILLILMHTFDYNFVNKIIYICSLLFMPFIFGTIDSYLFFVLMSIYCFLLGGLLSLLICYGYYKLKARKIEGAINPIRKKSLFTAEAIFIGFVLLAVICAY